MSFYDSYEQGDLLGSGAFAEVYLCSAKPHGSKYAVKIIKNAEPNVALEIDILKAVSHTNIVGLIDVFQDDKTIYMVQELIVGGEMFDYIIDKGTYNESDACKAFGMILEGLKYLHAKNIIHRDLKPENILLSEKSENAVIKLADFGLAKVISEHGMTSTTCGTPGYVAPEVLRQKKYDMGVDLWAAGVILYIMVSGYEPFYDENETQLFRNIMNGHYKFPKELFENVSPEIVAFIKRILVVDPSKRPSAEDCLKDPWLKDHTEAQQCKQLNLARANITKMQAKKKFKGALIAVRVGGRMKGKTTISGSGPVTPQTDHKVVDVDELAKEMDAQEIEAKEPAEKQIVKDKEDDGKDAEVATATAPDEQVEQVEQLPGQVPEE